MSRGTCSSSKSASTRDPVPFSVTNTIIEQVRGRGRWFEGQQVRCLWLQDIARVAVQLFPTL